MLAEFTSLNLLPQIDNFMSHAYDKQTAIANVLAVIHAVTGSAANV